MVCTGPVSVVFGVIFSQLYDPSPAIRRMVASRLRKFACTQAIVALQTALGDTDDKVRFEL